MVRLRSKTCPRRSRLSGPGRHFHCRRVWGQRPGQPHVAHTFHSPETDEEDRPSPAVPTTQEDQQVDVVIANGRRIVSDGVRALVEEKVGRLGRYCPGLERAEVRFSEEHNPRIVDRELCEVIMT